MSKTTTFRIATAAVIALSLLITGLLATPIGSSAFQSPPPAAPPNDNFANADSVSGSYYNASVDDTFATVEAGEPMGCYPSYYGYSIQRTVWYKFTAPSAGVAQFSVYGGVYENFVNVYRANVANPESFSDLSSQVVCGNYGTNTSLTVAAGETYYFQLGSLYAWSAGWLYFNFNFYAAPPNDNFDSAIEITGVPFNVSLDDSWATLEPGEPTQVCGYSMYHSVWYKYTPAQDVSILFRTTQWPTLLGIWTGNAVNALSSAGCLPGYNSAAVVRMQANTTYYMQVGDMGYCCGSIYVGFSMEVTPPPTVDFYYYPGDPSIFDSVQFYDSSNDPAYQGFQSWTWAFGDGGTATGQSATHKYAKDGDYTVEHTATTVDARTGSISRVVHVQTHDVAVTRLQAPNSAAARQTKQILASVASKRYDETVHMQLYKSVPGGLTLVGEYNQFVPVRPPGGKATDFVFNYTFTPEDLAIGKVTFRVEASIVNGRDALPADNEAIAPPTKVSR